MPTELISPNLHVVLIHYPLAMLIAGTLIELFSFLWRRSSFRVAGRWMILLGAMSAIPAAFSGIYALRDVSRVDMDTDMPWVDLKAASPVFSHGDNWMLLRNHMLYQSIATGVAALVVVVWLGCSDRSRRSLQPVLLLIMVWALAMMVRAAWFGGESVYKKGVAVEPVFPVAVAKVEQPSTKPVNWMTTPTRAEQLFPPIEMHTIMAGVTTAIALVAIGLSFRKITAMDPLPSEMPIVTGDPATALRSSATSMDMARQFNPSVEMEAARFTPSGRFWFLAFLLALVTLAGGLFVIARSADLLTAMHDQPKAIPQLLWKQIGPEKDHKVNRHVAHFAAGSAIVVLPIILGLITRFAPREKIILTLVSLVLIAAIGVQVWLGVLLMFDTDDGPVNHFNPSASAEVHSSGG
jgi:uncharacterized membrane protein